MPIQTFSRNEKIGENVEVGSLLKRIENQQQSAINNLASIMNTSVIPAIMNSQKQNSIFEGEFEPKVEERDLTNYDGQTLLEQINRDNKIDEAEKVNINDSNVEALYINNGEDEVEFGDIYIKKSIMPLTNNPLVFKRKEKKDIIPEHEPEVQQIQSMPLNISLAPKTKPRGRPKKTEEVIVPVANPPRGLMTTRKTTTKKKINKSIINI